MKTTLGALLLCWTFGACQLVPDSIAPATPQRPTLSSDTNTTPHRRFEVEAGIARDDRVSLDTPLTLKYGSGERTEVAIGWSPWRRGLGSAGRESATGDVVLGLRHRLADGEDGGTSFAFQSLVKLPTADDADFGTDAVDAQFAGIASRSFGTVGATGYYAVGALGDPSGGSSVSHSLAIALGAPVTERLGAFGEVAAVLVPETDEENIFTTIGATFTPDASLVFDAAIVLGLSDEAADWQALIGLTKNFGSIARARP